MSPARGAPVSHAGKQPGDRAATLIQNARIKIIYASEINASHVECQVKAAVQTIHAAMVADAISPICSAVAPLGHGAALVDNPARLPLMSATTAEFVFPAGNHKVHAAPVIHNARKIMYATAEIACHAGNHKVHAATVIHNARKIMYAKRESALLLTLCRVS
jgi:hypothetical protein